MGRNKYGLKMSHIWGCQLNSSAKDISINKKKRNISTQQESICGHRCEGTKMAAKCEISMNCSKKFHRHLQKQI